MWLIVLVIFILVVAVFIAMVQLSNEKDKKMEMEGHLIHQSEFSATQKFMGCAGESGIAIDEQRQKVAIISNKLNTVTVKVFSYRDIFSSEIFEDGSTVTRTSRTSQLGGALVGGILLGGVGAIVGGLTAKTKQGNVEKVVLRLVVNDTQAPIHDITFQNIEASKGGIINQLAMEQVRHWHGIIEVLIKRADMEDKNSSHQINQTAPQSSVADELKKLAELHSAGVLSLEEW